MSNKEGQQKSPVSRKGQGVDKTVRMGNAPVPGLLLEFAIPSIVGMLINSCYNVISTIFLGQAMGAAGLAVTTAAFPIMIIFMALAMLVGNGGNALASLRLGQGKRDAAELSLGNTVTLGIIISVIVFAFVSIPPCMDLLLSISSTTPEIYELTRNYVWILAAGVVFQVIGLGVNNFIRTAGAPNRALVTMLIGAFSSIFFNWLFVMVFGWGVEGSALATVVGWFLSCISVLWYFVLTPGVPLKLRARYMPLDGPVVKEILTLGMASFLLQTANCVANLFVNYQLVKYGALAPIGAENALASIGVVGKIAGIAFMPIVGVATAAQPLIGYNYGAGKLKRVRQTLGFAILYAIILGVAIWAVTRIWPTQIVGAFGVADDLMELSLFALEVQMLLIPVVGVQVCSGNYFQATGQPMKSIFLSLIRQVLYFIPALLILPEVLPLFLPVDGLNAIFATWPVADALSVVTAGIFIAFELRRLGKLERGEITDKYAGVGHGDAHAVADHAGDAHAVADHAGDAHATADRAEGKATEEAPASEKA
ncbi:MAG: MATE family efflux transporter [Eggerthellaceae bacterium]